MSLNWCARKLTAPRKRAFDGTDEQQQRGMLVTASKLSVVLNLAGGMWLVTCECGAEAVHKSPEDAFRWLVEHPCLLDLPAED